MSTKKNFLILFFSLCYFYFIPFLSTTVRSYLLAQAPVGLDISGHLEWYDLSHETIQAFFVVPFYFLLGRFNCSRKQISEVVSSSWWLIALFYTVFCVSCYFGIHGVVSEFATEHQTLVSTFLFLESISFLPSALFSLELICLLVLKKSSLITCLSIMKILLLIGIDLMLIPISGSTGAAISDILTSIILVVFGVVTLFAAGLKVSIKMPSKDLIQQWRKIGLYSGLQILVANLAYIFVVCRPIAQIGNQGYYWAANNIIWSLFLVPVHAQAEIIKQEAASGNFQPKRHISLSASIFLCWVLTIPLWHYFVEWLYGINTVNILPLLYLLMPFYVAYSIDSVCNSILVGSGNTFLPMLSNLLINLVYYPIWTITAYYGLWQPDLSSICIMFGFGMVLGMIFDSLFLLFYQKKQLVKTGIVNR